MHISSIRIANYKSYLDSGEIALSEGINLVVGPNDSGKSALLEALTATVPSLPHRTAATAPRASSALNSEPNLGLIVEISGDDIRRYCAPYPQISVQNRLPAQSEVMNEVGQLLEDGATVAIQFGSSGASRSVRTIGSTLLSVGANTHYLNNERQPTDTILQYGGTGTVGSSLADVLTAGVRSDIFRFTAQRFHTGSSPARGSKALAPDASNLADVVQKMQGNRAMFDRYMAMVTSIFPHITHIDSSLHGNDIAQLKIWSHDIQTERDDLGVPLQDSGSGVGQVLAMLYVIVNAKLPQVIIIDEPQSFLHPGAVRKLFEIFARHLQHQYVVTTHSPSGLGSVPIAKILQVQKVEGESRIQELDRHDRNDLASLLGSVGARMSDVFGSDHVLWVEGATEERCFPDLIRRLYPEADLGAVQILGVVATGDLEGKQGQRFFEIYRRLTEASHVMPPACGFVLDRERKEARQIEDIDRRSQGLVRWLPRRMYECYLIDTTALASLLNEIDGERSREVTAEIVDHWLREHFARFSPERKTPDYDGAWRDTVDAAKLLEALFGELTDERCRYDKVTHGMALTSLLVEARHADLETLARFVGELLPKRSAGLGAHARDSVS